MPHVKAAMDPNLLRHIDYFAVPNNQTVNPVDQNVNLSATTSATGTQSGIWDTSSLPAEATTTSMALGSAPRPNPYKPKTVLPTRTPPQRTREGHERKRSKLSIDSATPFDSVDYWLDFDNGEGVNGNRGTEYNRMNDKGGAATKRSNNATNQMATPAGSGIAPDNEVASGSGGLKGEPDDVDDSALENALSDNDDGLSMNLADHLSKIDSAPPAEVPPREGLYSTPLSWEKPQPGLRMDPLSSLHNTGTLNHEDQQRLIAIAMNPGSTTGGLGASIASTFGPAFGAHAYLGANMGMPTTSMSQVTNIPSQSPPQFPPMSQSSLGRNVSPSDQGVPAGARSSVSVSDRGKDKGMKGDRTAHNDIERKYRTNLKDKIAELRDAVPALRPIPENGVAEEGDGAGQPARAPKVSKGTVLSKATEYIHWLERRNKAIVREHNDLSRRLQAFEQLLNATTRQPYTMPNYSRTLFDPRGFC